MKINSKFKLREIAGESVIVRQGNAGTDLTHIIALNASAKLLYEQLCGKTFTTADAAQVLVETYSIDPSVAQTDAAKWVDDLKACHIIEE